MTWHLLISWPHHYAVPLTHKYREITHEEFRRLAKNLNIYHESGEIVIGDSLHRLIMSRLTDLEVSGPMIGELDGFYKYDKLPPLLGSEDSVLVFYGKSEGMYIGIKYARATQFEFNEMVVTGIIEPAEKQFGTDILAAADEFHAIKSRVQKAREILNSSNDGISEQHGRQPQEREVLQELEMHQKAILERLDAQPNDIDGILENHQKERESLLGEKRKLELKLQIERGLKEEDDHEQNRLVSRIKGVDATIKYEEDTIDSLKGLLEAISEPVDQKG